MKSFVKHMLAVGITSALSFSLSSHVEAATYQVVDKTIDAELKYTYAQQQNNNGVLAISGSNLYNFPIQFDYFIDNDFKRIQTLAKTYHERFFGLEDLEDYEALVEGNPTANDLAWAKVYLSDSTYGVNQALFEYQPVGDLVAMINLGGNSTTELFNVFDKPFQDTDTLTRTTVDIISGVTNSGVAYGSATAPYLPMDEFTTDKEVKKTFWLREFGQRGFFSYDNGSEIFSVVPPETRYGGGVSAVLDVNDSGEAVGYMSYDLNNDSQELVEKTDGQGCANPKVVGGSDLDKPGTIHIGSYPREICIQRLQSRMYELVAYKAKFNVDGEVTSEPLGLLIESHEDDERNFSSRALAINNQGVAVGFARGWNETGEENPVKDEKTYGAYAVMFKDGKVFDFNQKHFNQRNSFNSTYVEYSKAYDINDNGLVVGYNYNENLVKQFFYVDASVPESDMNLVMPAGFFKSSVSTAYAVNNNGMIVGDAEIETHNGNNDNPRRTVAFLYDTKKETFQNVNDLLGCKSPYQILEARDINDENIISGTAVFKVDRYDAKGKIILGDDGKPLQEDVVRAVILEPIEGEIEDCFEEEVKVERKGASSGFVTLFSLFVLFGFRRFRSDK
jgi:hypothetical protein